MYLFYEQNSFKKKNSGYQSLLSLNTIYFNKQCNIILAILIDK